MRLTTVASTGDTESRLGRIEHSINYREVTYPFPAIGSRESVTFAGGLVSFGGVAVDRSVFRTLLPDARWWVYAAGFVETSDANTVAVDLRYQKDDTTTVVLGTLTYTGGFTKQKLGPFDVFATVGVPAGETIPMVRLAATKNVAGSADLENWNVWLRLLPSKQ